MDYKKTISAKIIDNKIIVPQVEIFLGPLECESTKADWAMNDHIRNKPKFLSLEEKVNALLDASKGKYFIEQYEDQYKKDILVYEQKLKELSDDFNSKHSAYNQAANDLPEGIYTC